MNLKSSSSFQKLLLKVNAIKQFISNLTNTVNKNSSDIGDLKSDVKSILNSKLDERLNDRINFNNEYVNSRITNIDEYNKLLLNRIVFLESTIRNLNSEIKTLNNKTKTYDSAVSEIPAIKNVTDQIQFEDLELGGVTYSLVTKKPTE